MAAERVAAEEQNVQGQHKRSHAHAERLPSRSVRKPQRAPNIMGQDAEERQRKIKKVAVNILDNEWKRIFSKVSVSWFTNRTRRWVGPKRFVVCAAIVVASKPESRRRPK